MYEKMYKQIDEDLKSQALLEEEEEVIARQNCIFSCVFYLIYYKSKYLSGVVLIRFRIDTCKS